MSHLDPDVLALRALGEQASGPEDEVHLADCPQCQAELSRLSQVTALARSDSRAAVLVAPPAGTWAAIVTELGPELYSDTGSPAAAPDPIPMRRAEDRERTPRATWGRRTSRREPWTRRLVLAAVVGLLVGAGVAIGVRQLTQPGAPAVVGTVTLRPLPQFPQWKGASGRAVMQRTRSGTRLDVTLRAPSRKGYYEVWLLGRDGVKMISLGDLNRFRTGVFTLPPSADLSFYSRIDISLQPFNGSTVHAPDSVVRGHLP
ncbi:MAG TPA: anti-sigma factor [Streptosporangiaceae bacterium]